MEDDRRTRVVSVVLLLCILCGLLVWAGTLAPDPDRNEFPNEDSVAVSYADYVGDRVQFGGTVVETDPLVVETTPTQGAPLRLTVESFDGDPTVGDEINLYGTLESDHRVVVIDSYTREPWEAYYMYAVSFIAGIWVLGRFIRGWRFDRKTFAFEPHSHHDAVVEEKNDG